MHQIALVTHFASQSKNKFGLYSFKIQAFKEGAFYFRIWYKIFAFFGQLEYSANPKMLNYMMVYFLIIQIESSHWQELQNLDLNFEGSSYSDWNVICIFKVSHIVMNFSHILIRIILNKIKVICYLSMAMGATNFVAIFKNIYPQHRNR